jgi:hypothetical protein
MPAALRDKRLTAGLDAKSYNGRSQATASLASKAMDRAADRIRP